MTQEGTEGRTRIGTPVDGEHVLASLSPSRASDFRTCPLLYRLRTIDHLPETPSPDALRGTVVHKVLEDLFDLPAAERTPEQAESMVQDAWQFVLDAEPEAAPSLVRRATDEGPEITAWLASCRESLRAYFALEDPTRLEPAERELYVETLLDSRLLLRGFVDRIDVAPDGAIRVVDYKTGRSPGVGFEGRALFQMRFYALVIWRTRGVVPATVAAGLPRRRPDGQLRARRARPARDRAARRGDLARDRARPRHRRVPAQPGLGVHLVQLPGPLSRPSATSPRRCRTSAGRTSPESGDDDGPARWQRR